MLALLALSPVACSSASLSLSGGANPDTGTGGAGVSPGEVRIHVSLPASQFCDGPGCERPSHVAFTTAAGVVLESTFPACAPICSAQCQSSGCTGLCLGDPSNGHGLTGVDALWDGSYYVASTCGGNVTCFAPRFVPAGHYLAHVCVTPGVVDTPDAGGTVCSVTGPQQCLDVPIDLPGPSTINVAWPTDAGALD